MASKAGASIALCRYEVKPGREREFEAIVANHFPVLQKLGLVADNPPNMLFRGKTKEGKTYYVELLAWKDDDAVRRAHGLAEVSHVWEGLGDVCDAMDFPHVEEVRLR